MQLGAAPFLPMPGLGGGLLEGIPHPGTTSTPA